MQRLEQYYPFVIIDTEAGMEHISRGTIGHPDLLIIISDPGARGLRTVARIRSIAMQLGLEGDRILAVVNRYRTGMAQVETGTGRPSFIIPYDPEVERTDLNGMPVSAIPRTCPARAAISDLTGRILSVTQQRF